MPSAPGRVCAAYGVRPPTGNPGRPRQAERLSPRYRLPQPRLLGTAPRGAVAPGERPSPRARVENRRWLAES
jgi:hypothetical protein